jgi:hypothetical protein
MSHLREIPYRVVGVTEDPKVVPAHITELLDVTEEGQGA